MLVILVLAQPLWRIGALLVPLNVFDHPWTPALRESTWMRFVPVVFVLVILTFLLRLGLRRGWHGLTLPAAGAKPDPLWRKLLWVVLTVLLVTPLVWLAQAMTDSWLRISVDQISYLFFQPRWIIPWQRIDHFILCVLSVTMAPAVAMAVAWLGLRRGWHSLTGLFISAGLAIALVAFIAVSVVKVRRSSQDKYVLSNLRGLSAAADQYFLEYGGSTVAAANLIGATNYVKALNSIAHETYPEYYTQGMTITVTGIAGFRTVTYSP